MKTRVTLNHNLFRQLVEELGRDPAVVLRCDVGINRLRDSTTLLAHTLHRGLPRERRGDHLLVTAGIDRASLGASILRALARVEGAPPLAVVSLGLGEQAGAVCGVLRAGGSYAALDEVTLLDPGLPTARLTLDQDAFDETEGGSADAREIWSRSIGALGEAAWRRLTELHFGIVGCGRSGMEMATSLARLGAPRITVIDGDRLEKSNLGELFPGVSIEDVGQPKTDVLASLLSSQTLDRRPRLTAVAESITSQSALVAAKAADLLVCCVDRPMARAATAFLAKLYLLPLLDIGMGIHRGGTEGAGPRIGADVRLVLPDRCLLCFGGIRRIEAVRLPMPERTDWRSERAGSLRSLNVTAVGLGLRLIEELTQGRIRGSTWLQLNYGDDGLPALRSPIPESAPLCSLCRFTGRGDDGVGGFSDAVGAAELPLEHQLVADNVVQQ